MNAWTKAIIAGAAGAGATTLTHELTRRLTPHAPRVDLLGMQGLAHLLETAGIEAPGGSALFNLTLAGDLVSNTAYFGLVGAVPRDRAMPVGMVLGVVAGLGAVLLPGPLGLSTQPTERTTATKAMTVALYTIGGLATGATYQAIA
jgi:hypothetical protein